MAEIKDVVAYICKEYPHKKELSRARLTKLVYLADWKAAQETQETLTPINWVFNKFGPYVDDVINTVYEESDTFELSQTENMYGGNKGIIRLLIGYQANLDNKEKQILDEVMDETKDQYWDSFIEHVYNTYPIKVSNRFDNLNLAELAKESLIQ